MHRAGHFFRDRAGEIEFAFANMTDALPQVEAGTVRGLAVTSLGRSLTLCT